MYTFGEFKGEAEKAEKAKEEALAKRKKSAAPSPQRRGADETGQSDKKEPSKMAAQPKKKSSSDTVLEDPDLKL